MRDAANGKEALKVVQKKSGLKIDVISGEEESQIIYDNHLSLITASGGNYLYVDVGGGSTEVSCIKDGERVYSHSYNVGTLRLLNGKVKPATMLSLRHDLMVATEDMDQITIVGSGGNINKLYRIARQRDKQVDRLPVATLRRLYERLDKMSLEVRMDTFNMKPDRADVIVPAAKIFLEIADCVHATEIMVPNLGLADGIINELMEKYKAKH